jgi:membrane protease YdiL (CAAX protease family)
MKLQLNVHNAYNGQHVPLLVAGYLVALSVAEGVTVFVSARAGLTLHAVVLLLALAHAARCQDDPQYRLWAAVALIPLIRIVSLSLPLSRFAPVYWYLLVSAPLFAATAMVMRLLSLSWADVGVHRRGLPRQFFIALLGLGIGYVEYLILRPEPLIDEWSWRRFWPPALILLISTGFLEELMFRGVLQHATVATLGRARGVIFAALLFAVLHVGYRSAADVLFVLGVGLLFGWIALRTQSIIGVALAHGLTNVTLFLLAPFVAAA